MAKPLRNPFYWLLLACCAALLLTMFTYLLGGWATPHPDYPEHRIELPPLMQWVNRNALMLIIVEVSAIVVTACLTIGLDRFFDSRNECSESA